MKKINYGSDLAQDKQKLLGQLAEKTEKKHQAYKQIIIGVVIWFVSLLLDWLYHIILFVTEKNLREGRAWAGKMIKFLDVVFREQFHFWLILFALTWIIALIIAIQGLVKWLNFRGQIKKIEIEIANLKR